MASLESIMTIMRSMNDVMMREGCLLDVLYSPFEYASPFSFEGLLSCPSSDKLPTIAEGIEEG